MLFFPRQKMRDEPAKGKSIFSFFSTSSHHHFCVVYFVSETNNICIFEEFRKLLTINYNFMTSEHQDDDSIIWLVDFRNKIQISPQSENEFLTSNSESQIENFRGARHFLCANSVAHLIISADFVLVFDVDFVMHLGLG